MSEITRSVSDLGLRRPCLLIVEDDPDIACFIQDWLARRRIRCVVAASTAEALQIMDDASFIESGFDGLLADYRLPDATGCRVISEFLDTYPGVPAALMTAYSDISLELWLNAQRIPLFRKPLELGDVHAWTQHVSRAFARKTRALPNPT